MAVLAGRIGSRNGRPDARRARLAALAGVAVCWLGAIAPASASAATISAPVVKQGYITVADGTQLKYWLGLPAATGRFPVALAFSAYSEGVGDFSSTGNNPVADNLLAHGYAVLGVNVRGTGCSGGILNVLSQQDSRDGYEVVEWAAAQPWSTGHVGMWGNSYVGSTQLPIAALHPPHLDAISPWHPLVADPYRNAAYPGGMLNEFFAAGWSLALEPENMYVTSGQNAVKTQDATCARNIAEHTATGVNGLLISDFIDHPYDDGLYSSRAVAQDFSGVSIPALVCLGWQDDALPPLDLATRMLNDLSQNLTWVVAMNIYHTGCSANSSIGTLSLLDRFFDRYLKGDNNGWEQTPHVQLWHETHKDASGTPTPRWVTTASSWSAIKPTPVSLFLGSGNSLSLSKPSTAQAGDSYTYPLEGASTEGGYEAEDKTGMQTAVAWKAPVVAAGTLEYATPPVAHDAEFFGTGSANLWLASSATDTDLQVTITEVRPDGQETYVQRGWLRASMRKLDDARSTALEPYPTFAQSDVQPLLAGQPVYVRVPLFAFDHVFRKGSSIRMWIDAPTGITGVWRLGALMTPATNTILHDPQHPSSITLGWLPSGNAEGSALPACDSVLNQPCRTNPDPVPGGTMTITAPVTASRSHLRRGARRGHRPALSARHRMR